MKRTVHALLGLLLTVVLGSGAEVFTPGACAMENPVLFEIVLRSELIASVPVYHQDHPDDPNYVIGFNTVSSVYLISSSMPNGIVPSVSQGLGTYIGSTASTIRFPRGVYADKTQPWQIASGVASFRMDGASVFYQGSVIVRWVQDPEDPSLGPGDVRWTDFSMGITEAHDGLAGWKGHVVGTRLLVGANDSVEFQSGIVIFRFMR